MSMLVLGLSHNSASEKVRERIAFPPDILVDACKELMDEPDVTEAVLLSTCNRTEIYLDMKQDTTARDEATSFLTRFHGLSHEEEDEMRAYLFVMSGAEMVSHLFSVASSLDSQVLGETQIVAQLKEAYRASVEAGGCQEVFKHLFQQAFQVGKRVRSETEIGAHSVSISTSAVDLAIETFGALNDRRVAVVGAGKMGELTCRYLVEQGAREVRVVNRTFEAAEMLASRMGGLAVPFSDLDDVLTWADIVVCATSAPGFVIAPDNCPTVHKRGERELLLIDIALPRDIDPACADLDGISLYNLDDLISSVEGNRELRERELFMASSIVADETSAFLAWMQERQVYPTITHIYEKMERVCEREAKDAAHSLELVEGRQLDDAETEVLERLARKVGRKIVHGPTIRLKKQASNAGSYRYTDAARYLFGLDTSPLGRRCRSCELASECRRGEGGSCLIATEEEMSD